MIPTNIAQIPLIFCAVLAIAALYGLLLGFTNFRSLDNVLKQLPRDLPTRNPFDEKTPLGKSANEYVMLFAHCARNNGLGAFNVERASAPVQAQIRILANSPRNLAGVMILCGLLVTLFNLQGSVGVLGLSFSNLAREQLSADPASAEKDVKLIQQSMGEIAQTARNAFLLSGEVILTAAIVVWLSLLLQKAGQRSAAHFAGWANAAYLEAVLLRPMDQHAQLQKFGEMIEKMASLMTSLEAVSASMASAGDLGQKLDASSQIVAQAVGQLPASINASVVQLSAEVTKDISVHLQHQIQHLQKVLAIYGDQANGVRQIQKCLDSFSESMSASAKTVKDLASLPTKIDTLSAAIVSNNNSVADVARAAGSLSKKIEDLPATQLQDILAGIQAIRNDLPVSVRATIEPRFDSIDERLGAMNHGQIVNTLSRLRTEIEGLPDTLKSAEVLATVTRLNTLISESQRARGRFDWFRSRGAGN